MINVQDWLSNNTSMLLEVNIDSARLDCIVMLEDTLKKPREWLLGHGDHLIDKSEENKLNSLIKLRLDHIPLAYITGYKEFYGRNFVVNPSVLIPRPESEDIIELLLELDEKSFENIIDVGTGSGCLAITAKLEIPEWKVTAVDNSEEAISLAKKNAQLLGAKVKFLDSDLLNSLIVNDNTVIIANLPYVPSDLITSQEIKKEPSTALFSGDDGLDHYKKFWTQISSTSASGFTVITESLINQHDKMIRLAKKSDFKLIRTKGLAQSFSNT